MPAATLHDIEEGTVQDRYDAPFDREYDCDPPPRRDLIPREAFLTTTSVIATRGCRNRCSFCYLATDGVQTPYAVRNPEDVAPQIRADRQPLAVFVDNNLGASRGYLRRLCAALRPLETMWTAAVTLDVTDDPSLVREMSVAGCAGVFVGFETLNDENLIFANKRSPRAEDYERRVRVFRDCGIQVNGSFVVGFDHDQRDVFTTLAQWIDAARLECATFHILTPYPGTPLFRQMEEDDRLLHRDWGLYDTAHVVFQPKHMAPDELQQGYEWLYRRLFSHASIRARRPAAPLEWPAYFAAAYLYKHANRLWPFLIRRRLVHAAWRPLVELARRRHLRTRRRLLRAEPNQRPADIAPNGAQVRIGTEEAVGRSPVGSAGYTL